MCTNDAGETTITRKIENVHKELFSRSQSEYCHGEYDKQPGFRDCLP